MATGRPDVLDPSSGSRRVVDLLASTATVLVVHALGDQRLRFGQIEQRVAGISQQTLTGTLRELARHGLVEVVPDGDGYQLTQLGRSLLDAVIAPFCSWAQAHADDVRTRAPRPAGGGCARPTC
jgi:DNA-binding HxlR family transcriptional regulator